MTSSKRLVLVLLTLVAGSAAPPGEAGENVRVTLLLDGRIACRDVDHLHAAARRVERYFDAMSYARATVRFDFGYGVVDIDGLKLADPATPLDVRRSALESVVRATRGARHLLAVPSEEVWPFVLRLDDGTGATLSAGLVPRDVDWGTLAHETAHLLGLPDLYDQHLAGDGERAATSLGAWCLMSRSVRRPGLCGWSRRQLGWIAPADLAVIRRGETKVIALDPLTHPRGHALLASAHIASNRYYLVEARTRHGDDAPLPAEGVLVTSVNYFERDPARRVRIVDARAATPTLSDAAFDLRQSLFRDELNDVEISVRARRAGMFLVEIRNGIPSGAKERER